MRSFHRVLGIAFLFLPLDSFAQSCPEGTTYTFTETVGRELIVHCAKPERGPAGALELLHRSELGAVIADFLEARRIPIRVVKRIWAPGSGAAFDWVKREIALPPGSEGRDAVSLALSIAHEGYHAMQSIERGMIACVEAEEDAMFAQYVVYEEMMSKGVRPVPKDDPLAADLALAGKSVAKRDLEILDHAVKDAYADRRRWVLNAGWLPAFARLPAAVIIRIADAGVDLTDNFETLDQHRRHPAYWWDKMPVKRSEAAHAAAVEWKLQWMNEHALPR